ncbi:MAG: polysaccharide deacetylase family protein [Coriobacteriales bacterium]|nr:polysaccharide deacetylase family protein [Coriobacteriales bacterium]
MPANTTYAKLQSDGYLKANNGNLLAVTGTILTKGAGASWQAFDNGVSVSDLNQVVPDGAVITCKNGSDDTEPVTSSNSKVIPWTWQIAGGNKFNFYNSTLHVLTQIGKDGEGATQTGDISGQTVVENEYIKMQPQIMKDISAETKGKEKVVCLTYDDGPSPDWTQKILKVLQQNKVKATFFEIGNVVKNYPSVSKDVVTAGMELCSHSYNHSPSHYLNKLSEAEAKKMAEEGVAAIKDATGVTTTYLRPPGGNLNATAIKGIGSIITAYIGWNIDTDDWQRPGANKIYQTALNGVKKIGSGSVILMHDGGGDRSETLAATKKLIPKLKKMGYSFITIDQLIKIRKSELGLK